MFCLHRSISTMPIPDDNRGQKKALEPMELELQVAQNCHVETGNQTQVCKSSGLLTTDPSFCAADSIS